MTLKKSDTPSRHVLFQLAPSVPRTEGIGCGLLPTVSADPPKSATPEQWNARMEKRKLLGKSKFKTPLHIEIAMLPTPKSQNANGPAEHGQGGKDLQTFVSMLPTPATRDYKGANGSDHMSKDRPHMDQLPNAITHGTNRGLKLQPAFVEWMMGYPDKWTELID